MKLSIIDEGVHKKVDVNLWSFMKFHIVADLVIMGIITIMALIAGYA